MEQNNRWVDDRLAKLNPDSEWQPRVTTALARLEGRRAQGRFVGRTPRLLGVAAIAAICILTFPAPRAFAQRVLAPCVEACENLSLAQGDIHYRLHRLIWSFHSWMQLTVPDYAFEDSAGANFRLSDYAGKVVLLNFWATWCVPCQKEIPWFVEFERKYGDKGLAVIGISLDEDGWKTVRPVMESQQIGYRVALGNDEMVQRYGESLPMTMLIDGDGRILTKHVGITSNSQYEREIVRALWKDLSPAERDRLRAQGL